MKTNALAQVAELNAMPMPQLKERWKAVIGTEPPVQNRAHMVKRLAYRIQELAFGGLPEETKERLREIAESHTFEAKRPGKSTPIIGTRLIREYNGERHEVTVVHNGYEYRGRHFKSLSGIARVMTGTHWNGPAFFGLRKPGKVA